MDITRIAIEKDRIFWVVFSILLISGLSAFFSLPKNEDPGFLIRTAFIETMLPGASPERIELLITDKLEKEIQQMPEVKHVTSESKVGVSHIYVDLKDEYKDLPPIWNKLRQKVDNAKAELPTDTLGPYVNDEFGDIFGTVISITGDGFDYRQLKQVADEVRNELLLLKSVAKVQLVGAQDERVYLEYDIARLSELGISPTQLQGILQQKNIVKSGGSFSTNFEKIIMEPTGSFNSIEDIRNTIINIPDTNNVIKLSDVLTIQRGIVDPQQMIIRDTTEPSLILALSLKEGGNIITLGEEVKSLIERVKNVYPVGIDFNFLFFMPETVEAKIDSFLSNVYQAIAIVMIVMLIFLGFRTGFIVASLIPSAMIITLFLMQNFNIGLDQMSLASLIIALGMLVDNAIVMTESIMVRTEKGENLKSAALGAAKELKLPLLVSSLTTSAAFLPIFLAESEVGEYTAPLFKVVTITLLVSWLLALTLIPLLCVLFMKVKRTTKNEASNFTGGLYSSYRKVLIVLVKRPFLAIVGVIGLFYFSLQGFAFIENEFFGKSDTPIATVEIETPDGSPIERTIEIVDDVEHYLKNTLLATNTHDGRGYINWGTYIGSGPPRFSLSAPSHSQAENYAMILGNLTDIEIAEERIFPTLEPYIRERYPDVNATVGFLPVGTGGGAPVQIRVMGNQQDKLFSLVNKVKAQLGSIPGTKNIVDDWGTRSKKVVMDIDNTRAQIAGVTNEEIAVAMQTYLTGLDVTNFREQDKLIPIVLRSKRGLDNKVNLDHLSTVGIYSQAKGYAIPVSQVVDMKLDWQTSKIFRRDRLKTVTVSAYLEPGINAFDVSLQMEDWLESDNENWPFGYKWELGGEIESSGEAQNSIFAKLGIAAVVILLLLVGQFNSIRKTAIVLVTIPLSLIGVVIGLIITDQALGFMTMLGIISLAGIVINNAIVLLDRIRIESEEMAKPISEAILYACQQRLRPILLTTATTIGGMLPLWIGGGPLWESMAVAVIFGILFATLLTLGVVPVLYALFYNVKFRDGVV